MKLQDLQAAADLARYLEGISTVRQDFVNPAYARKSMSRATIGVSGNTISLDVPRDKALALLDAEIQTVKEKLRRHGVVFDEGFYTGTGAISDDD